MSRRTGKITWTAILLKKDFTETNAIKEDFASRLRRYEVMAPERIGQLVVGPKRPSPPRWLRHVKPYAPSMPELMNDAVSAVLVVSSASRTFALTFGYGRSLSLRRHLRTLCVAGGCPLRPLFARLFPGRGRLSVTRIASVPGLERPPPPALVREARLAR